ncbi:N-acetylglucosamine-6-phosphate deacetylase [Halalkalibacter krulwichiae]|uniref:N-acetylglucosamine-6-phosphate deacetylase n=1 Tax=Halalkalibacter krulwichiae TaxID=199441 RepID=A0A1X9MG37_9BACI|nr:amidohydrolase family protein [Halalkalibacter krulwichiae]ARK32425.1 N-acetylglucosamine-6-phosphate deacetylase [Halalkalibacter krulwichiae]
MSSTYTKVKGLHYQTNKPIEIIMEAGKIKRMYHLLDSNDEDLPIVAPGLIDLQINGFKGIDFNHEPLNKEQWLTVTNELAKVGVTTFYPTMITNSQDQLASLFEENKKTITEGFSNNDMIAGFHLEGPYISREEGPRGAHPKEHVRSPNWKEFTDLQEKAGGLIKLVTLSPEWEASNDFIQRANEHGVKVVALGHLNATEKQIDDAVRAGAVASTHLGNGAHVSLPRHPNYLWDQLAKEELWATVIADGHHLPTNVLKVMNLVKKEKMVLVSDAVSLAGMQPGHYHTAVGGKVTLTDEYKLHLRGNPQILAGSAQSLLMGVNHLIVSGISTRSEALDKASILPAKLMNLPQQLGLSENAPADLVLLREENGELEVVETVKSGRV